MAVISTLWRPMGLGAIWGSRAEDALLGARFVAAGVDAEDISIGAV
jgi:hypothetical protein